MTPSALGLAAGVDWTAAVGRLHPLVLHLPIGVLVALAAVELVRRLRSATEPDGARGVLVALLAISTFLAALTGWLLHESDDYGSPVELHEWLGIALLAVTLVVAVAHRRGSPRFGAWLAVALALLVPTAHFGAGLTHGSGFLLEPWRAAASDEHAAIDDADPYAAAAPFFAAYCTRCHGPEKQKRGLALHDFASLTAGGDDGPVVVAGDPAASALITRCRLPLDDDDHMPPEGKRQPTADELDALAEWVRALDGALDATQAERLARAGEAAAEDTGVAPRADESVAPEPATPADLRAVDVLRERLVHVAPVSAETPLLLVDFGAAPLTPDELRVLLAPLREHVADLGLGGHELSADDLRFVAELPRLERLDLRELDGAPLDLAPLSTAARLATLNLAGTTTADGAVDALLAMPSLRSVFVWRTGLTEDDVARLAAARPELAVRSASAEPDAPLEVEPQVAFEAYAPESATDLRPTNERCPITGEPVDPRFAIVAEGRVVGFCCARCPAKFWKEASSEHED